MCIIITNNTSKNKNNTKLDYVKINREFKTDTNNTISFKVIT